ncbi:MAG TPA: Hsp20/alpha crystallin family protein [Burkholderiales bacterium]|nr:Hsp20/alpha crystallin family protein [Burkholderiales bacterium]
MANIVRYTPFGEVMGFAPFWSASDDLVRDLFARPFGMGSLLWGDSEPFRMSIAENEHEYRVTAELPGARKEDIAVSVNGPEVTISAEIRNATEGAGQWSAVYSERLYGKLQRAFTLECEVDAEKAQARYADGVLELVLPKKEEQTRKRLTIH